MISKNLKIGRLKKDLKWNYGISFGENPATWNRLATVFSVWCFKLNKIPDYGTENEPKLDYKGFWYRKELFNNLEVIVYTKSVRVIYWFKIKKK